MLGNFPFSSAKTVLNKGVNSILTRWQWTDFKGFHQKVTQQLDLQFELFTWCRELLPNLHISVKLNLVCYYYFKKGGKFVE